MSEKEKKLIILVERVETFLECHGKSQETPTVLKRLKKALDDYIDSTSVNNHTMKV